MLQALSHSGDTIDRDQLPCPECLTFFTARQPGQLFCCPQHRDAWNNRTTVRGRVLTPLAIVARVTRSGSRASRFSTNADAVYGERASRDQDALIRRWVREDQAAGRMDWAQYLRRRYLTGFDPL